MYIYIYLFIYLFWQYSAYKFVPGIRVLNSAHYTTVCIQKKLYTHVMPSQMIMLWY